MKLNLHYHIDVDEIAQSLLFRKLDSFTARDERTVVSISSPVKINNFEAEIVIVVVLLFTKGLISLKNVTRVEFNFLLRGKHFFDGNLSTAL